MSYTWRSILKGVEVLKAGIVCRIGDGSKVNIWDDPWIPRDSTRKPLTPRGRVLISRVSELINPITNGWDEELVKQTCVDQDVEIILSTPVHIDLEDLMAWHYDSKGLFSVKSAYKVYREHLRNNSSKGATSSADGGGLVKEQWKKIWSLKCPGKIRQFLWRFTHNSLAVNRNLERRGMEVDTGCIMCKRKIEDGGHLFFNCKWVNKMAEEFIALHQHPAGGQTSRIQRWNTPPATWLKINSDGAFLVREGRGAWGFVIRDEDGDVITTGNGHMDYVRDALHTEAHASLQGIRGAAMKGMTKVILEMDSLILKQALDSDAYRLAEVGGVIYELKSLIASSFTNFLCKFAPRSCNKVAHALAASGLMASHGYESHWDSTPVSVRELVASDLAAQMS
jgi:hypothetical protein